MVRDSARNSEVSIVTFTHEPVRTRAVASAVLGALRLLPEKASLISFAPDENRDHRCDIADVDSFEELWCNHSIARINSSFILLRGKGRTGTRGLVAFSAPPVAPYSSMTVTLPNVRSFMSVAELLALTTQLFESFLGEFGAVRQRGEFLDQHQGSVHGGSGVVGVEFGVKLPGVYFANLFSRELAGRLPKGALESLPGRYVCQTANGGYLIRTAESPEDWSTPSASDAREHVRRALGADRFFDRRHDVHPHSQL